MILDLETIGMKPRGLGIPESDASTTDFEDTEEGPVRDKDPTEGLPPIVMSKEWATSGPPPKGTGWWGIGPPVMVHAGSKTRSLEDGLGLCSPGRWRPQDRRLPNVGSLAKEFREAMGLKSADWDNTLMRMMLGKLEGCPFSNEELRKGEAFLQEWVAHKRLACSRPEGRSSPRSQS